MFIGYATIQFSNFFVLPYQRPITKFACAAGPNKAGRSCILRAKPNPTQQTEKKSIGAKRRTTKKNNKISQEKHHYVQEHGK